MQATEAVALDVAAAYRSLAGRLEQIVRYDVRAPDPVIEDACQFAWTRLVMHAGRVRPECTLSWLTRTAIHEAVKLIRRADRDLSLESDVHDGALSGDGSCSAISDTRSLPHERAEHLERLALVRRLPQRQQRMVWLHALGLSYEEISDEVGCSRRTVERQLLRAKCAVRKAAAE